MRKHSVFDRFALVAATATVAAHANGRADGFRQKDVRFLMELFCNWIESFSRSEQVLIQNTQVLRYLKELEQDGLLRLMRTSRTPLYRLTRTGLIELVSRASNTATESPAQFFFLYYFISSYRPKIFDLVKAEGKQFPYALELELEGLLDSKALLDREIKNAERKLREMDLRVSDGQKAAQLTTESIAKKVPYAEIVKKWEKLYPYGLNSHKPLSELFAEISPDIANWEIETGNIKRVENMWKPIRSLHARYLETLRQLSTKT
ncbi:MAG: hypothetical protein J0M12_01475 [Deltaproteobacteria bacterium]|nr:hypothetical protein [Deltaproteobacteria bacterium]